MSTKYLLVGEFRVPLPPSEAFRLFTPLGERDWAHGWEPHFPVPVEDDSKPGTVFETDSHGRSSIWVVTDREAGKRISYARFTPGDRAGTVSVVLTSDGDHSQVKVTYELTALADAALDDLVKFADGYAAYLESWHHAILHFLSPA